MTIALIVLTLIFVFLVLACISTKWAGFAEFINKKDNGEIKLNINKYDKKDETHYSTTEKTIILILSLFFIFGGIVSCTIAARSNVSDNSIYLMCWGAVVVGIILFKQVPKYIARDKKISNVKVNDGYMEKIIEASTEPVENTLKILYDEYLKIIQNTRNFDLKLLQDYEKANEIEKIIIEEKINKRNNKDKLNYLLSISKQINNLMVLPHVEGDNAINEVIDKYNKIDNIPEKIPLYEEIVRLAKQGKIRKEHELKVIEKQQEIDKENEKVEKVYEGFKGIFGVVQAIVGFCLGVMYFGGKRYKEKEERRRENFK